MQFQIINHRENKNFKSRIDKELKEFILKVDSIKTKSQNMLSNLQQLETRMEIGKTSDQA